MDGEFRTDHLGVVDFLEEEKDLENEQAALDDHDNRVTGLFGRLANLATPKEGVESQSQIHGGVCIRGSCTWKGTFGRFPKQSLLLQTKRK